MSVFLSELVTINKLSVPCAPPCQLAPRLVRQRSPKPDGERSLPRKPLCAACRTKNAGKGLGRPDRYLRMRMHTYGAARTGRCFPAGRHHRTASCAAPKQKETQLDRLPTATEITGADLIIVVFQGRLMAASTSAVARMRVRLLPSSTTRSLKPSRRGSNAARRCDVRAPGRWLDGLWPGLLGAIGGRGQEASLPGGRSARPAVLLPLAYVVEANYGRAGGDVGHRCHGAASAAPRRRAGEGSQS